MITSAYIHIPFCRRKCFYCSFVSYPNVEIKEQYIDALCKEIRQRYKGEKLKTLYIGGGTPSLLTVSETEKILENFIFDEETEVTCEANPEQLSLEWLQGIKKAGVNRLSIGSQSFNDKILSLAGRKHQAKDIYTAVDNAEKSGFDNISLDLIYGLPEQTEDDFVLSVKTACELNVQHLSSYGLKIEQGSYFYDNTPENIADEDIQADMYLKLCEIAEEYGYFHYEISNFGKKNYFSKHNLNYWNAENYYGFGCAASGYEQNTRYSHPKITEKYIENPYLLTDKEILSKETQLEEMIFLSFRKAEGLKIKEVNEKFDIDFEKKYSTILRKYSDYLIKTSEGYAFSDRGFLISNYILSDFMEE